MIVIDRRQGSGDLVKKWPEATLGDLRFGDVAILGRGPGDIGQTCGIEIKGITEILGDLHGGRFLGYQAPGLRRSYDICWLVVEGEYKRGPDDTLLIPRFSKASGKVGWVPFTIGGKTTIAHSTAMALLLTVVQKGGISIWMTKTRVETLVFCQQLAAWWLEGYDSHHSLETFYTPPAPGLLRKEHSLLRLWLKELRGVGWKRSADAETAFESARDMATAGWERFAEIKGISERMAKEIVGKIQHGTQ